MSETTEEIVKEEQGLALYEKKALANVKPFEAELAALKEKHKDIPPLVFGAEGSKDIYRKVKAAEADFRSIKAPIEEARKLDKAAVKRLGEVIDEHYNLVKNEAEKIQLEKKAEREAYEKEDQRIKDEKKEAEEKQILEREREIFAIGGKYDKENDTFSLGTVENIKRETIKTASAELYQNEILRLFKEAADKIEAERLAEEQSRQEAQKEQEKKAKELKDKELQLQQREAEQLQERYEIRMDRLRAIGLEGQPTVNVKEISNDEFRTYYDKVAEEIAAAKQAETDRKERERIAEEQKRVDEELRQEACRRIDALVALGLTYLASQNSYVFADVNISIEEIKGFDKPEWDALVDKVSPVIADRKAEAERVRLEELEKQEQKKVVDEIGNLRKATLSALDYDHVDENINLGTISPQEWVALFEEKKSIFDKKKQDEWLESERIKKIQLEEQEKERLAGLAENKRWHDWKEKHLLPFMAEIPEFTTKRYARARKIALEKFEEIITLKPGNF